MATKGSSPRVRGKQAHVRLRRRPARLIPARAGKTRGWPGGCSPTPAHPRACGENGRRPPGPLRPAGSSPRVRGKPFPYGKYPRLIRLIPARAGKTNSRRTRPTAPGAHPRACGENSDCSSDAFAVDGSSPRVRGKPRSTGRRNRPQRLIPARAGKTGGSVCRSASQAAHPRACGENTRVVFLIRRGLGSSPRVRGKQRSP